MLRLLAASAHVTVFIGSLGILISRTQFYIPDEISYGTEDQNGSWSGMVGEVVKRRADIGLNLFIFTSKRAAAVDFFSPIFSTK
jgi:hypothetical protein